MARDITLLQQAIIEWRFEHPTSPMSECARALKQQFGRCSYSAVYNTTKNPKCVGLYHDLVQLTQTAKVLSVQEKREILAEVVRTDLTQFLNESGLPELNKTSSNRRAVAEYEVDPETGKRKIKLVSKLDAIDLDNKMLNLYKTDTILNINKVIIISEVVMVRPEGSIGTDAPETKAIP